MKKITNWFLFSFNEINLIWLLKRYRQFQALVEDIMKNYDERKKQQESLLLERLTIDGIEEKKKCCKI